MTETHSDLTTGVSYTYDRMSRIKTVADVTGTRTFNYTEYAGLKLDEVNLPDSFYGTANLHYNYEDPSASSDDYIHGRFKDVRFNGVVWMEKYQEATGRPAAHVASKAVEYPRTFTFSYTWDTDSNHLEKVSEGSYSQERYFESWRETREKTYTKWGAAYRTKFETAVLTPQHQYESYVLRRPDHDSLAAKYGATSAITFSFKYDYRGQVVDFDSSYTGLAGSNYSYDTAGNRTHSSDLYATSLGYTAKLLNQIEPNGGLSADFTYDADGNLTGDPIWLYTWDANNRLATMKKKDNTRFLRFAYDYQGRRVEKKVYPNGTGTGSPSTHLKFLYNGMELLVELKGSDNSILKTFHWGLDKTDTRGAGGGTEGLLLIHDWAADKSYFPSYDMNGNVVGLLDDDSGLFAAWYAYDAFGNVTAEGGAWKDSNPMRFATQYTDEETGLVCFGFRYYDPRKGRFLNRDPIGERGGHNLYRYAGNDPANQWDVWGLIYGELTTIDEVPPRNEPRDMYDVRNPSYWDTHSYTYPEDELDWMEDYREEYGPQMEHVSAPPEELSQGGPRAPTSVPSSSRQRLLEWELAQRGQGLTIAVGLEGSGAFGFRGTGSGRLLYSYTGGGLLDLNNHVVGLLNTGSPLTGVSTSVSGAFGVVISVAKTGDPNSLEGRSISTGISAGQVFVGGYDASNLGTDGPVVHNFVFGVGTKSLFGVPALPAEAHVNLDFTSVDSISLQQAMDIVGERAGSIHSTMNPSTSEQVMRFMESMTGVAPSP